MALLITLFTGTILWGQPVGNDTKLHQGRDLFYKSVESKDAIPPALKIFSEIQSDSNQLETTATVYIGALTCLQGKHAFWPQQKWNYVQKGLAIMDNALSEKSDNIEALFVRATTTYYLPAFFHRQSQSKQDMRKISHLLVNMSTENYSPNLLSNVVDFIRENGDLTADESHQLHRIQSRLAKR